MLTSCQKLQSKHWILFSLIIALSACDQTTSEKPVTASSSTSSITAIKPHAGHDISHIATASSSPQANLAYSSEYQHAMTAMHEQMMTASKIVNPDVAFAAGMIAHHQGAIEMAKIQLKYGKDSQMRQLAQNIIKAQQTEITQMQTWLDQHKNETAPTTITVPDTNMSMDMQNHDSMMQGIMEANPDIAFAKGMIPHHQGAIDMANNQFKLGKDTTMLALAKKIKAAQDPEIKQMQAWLAKNTTK